MVSRLGTLKRADAERAPVPGDRRNCRGGYARLLPHSSIHRNAFLSSSMSGATHQQQDRHPGNPAGAILSDELTNAMAAFT